ncbi:unnamed protein product [Nesidiocoris tenuis]|uniref:DUF7041 domain-containing protein n=1 Tax=Nesidiocoris tenuis TaxID=355587 RepID=A0A6H5HJJ9_9HEMI|nr:unnamed protein product [Nesidiocoris tenuis]
MSDPSDDDGPKDNSRPGTPKPTSAKVGQIDAVKIGPIWRKNTKIWFRQIEAQFANARCRSESRRYNYVLASLEPDVVELISDFFNKDLTNQPYTDLKARLIAEFEESENRKLLALVAERPLHLCLPWQRRGQASTTTIYVMGHQIRSHPDEPVQGRVKLTFRKSLRVEDEVHEFPRDEIQMSHAAGVDFRRTLIIVGHIRRAVLHGIEGHHILFRVGEDEAVFPRIFTPGEGEENCENQQFAFSRHDRHRICKQPPPDDRRWKQRRSRARNPPPAIRKDPARILRFRLQELQAVGPIQLATKGRKSNLDTDMTAERFRRGNMLRCSYNKDAYNCSSGINYYDTLCPDDEIPFFEEAYHNMTSNSSMFDGCEQIRQNLIQDGAFPWFLRVEQKSVPLDDYDQIPDSNGIPYHLLVQMGLAESSQDMNEPLEGYSSRIEGQRLLDSCHSNSEYEGLQFDGNYFGIRHPHKSNGIAQTQTLFTGQVTSEMVRSKYFDDLDELPEPGFIGKYSRRYDSDAESSRNTADSRTTLSDIFLREEAASSTKSQQPNFHRNRSKIDFEKWKIESKPQCISSIRNEDSESTYPASNSPTESQSTITQLFSVFDQDDQIANRSAKEREIVKTHGTPVDSIRNSEMQTAKTDSTPEPHSLSDLNEHELSKDAASPKIDTPPEGKQIDEVGVTIDGKIQTEDVQLIRNACSPKIVGKCKTLDNDNGGPQSEEEIGGKIDENTIDEMFQARQDSKTVDLPVDADNLLDVKAVENGDNLQKEVAALENKDDDERWSISDMLQDEDADQPGNEKDLAESKDDDEDDRWTISDLLLDLETPKETEQSDILENGGIPQNCESPKNIDARSSANQDDRQAIEDILPDDFDFGSEVEETFQVFQSQYFELCPTDDENISTNLESSKNIAKPECKTRIFDTSIKLDEDLPWKTHIRQNVLDRAAEIARRGQIEPTDDPLVVSLYFENSENNPVQKEQWTNHRARMECDVRLDDGKVIFDRFMVEIESTCNERSQMSEDMFQSLNLGENEIKPSGSLENGTEERMGGLTEDAKNFANLGPPSRRNVQESHLHESTLDAHEMNEASPLSGNANEEDKVRRIHFDDKDPEKLDGIPDRLQAVTSSPEPSKKVIHPDNVGGGFVSKDSQIEPLAAQSSTAPDESLKMSNGINLQTCRQQSGSQDSLSSTHDAPQIETLMVHPTIEDIPGAAPKSCSSADHPGFENSISTARVMVSDKRLPESEATINSTGKSPGKVNVQEKSKSLVTPPKDAENPESFLGKKFTSKPTSPPSDSSARPKSKTSSTTKITLIAPTGGVLGSNLVMAQLDNPSQPPLEGSVVEAFSTKENLLNVPEVHIVPKEAITHSRTDGSSHSGMQDTISCHESSRRLPFVSNTIVDSPTKVDSHRTAIAQTTDFGDSRNTSLDSPQNPSDPKDPKSDDPKPVTGRPSVRNSSLSEETVMKMYTEIFNADARTSDVDISLMNAFGPNKALHSYTLKNFELDATSNSSHQDGVYQFLKTPVTEEIVPHQSPSNSGDSPSRKRHLQRTIFGSPPAKKIGLQDQKITNFFPSVKMMNTDGSMDQFFDAPCTYDTLTDHKTQLFHQIDVPRKRKTPIVEILKSIDVIDEGRQSSRLSNVTYHRKYEFNNLPPGSVTSMDQYKRYTKNNSSGPIQVSRSLNVDEFDRFPLISHRVTDGNHEIIDLKEDKVEKTATRMESIGDLVEIGFTICYK